VAVPRDWSINISFANGQVSSINDPRAICPHCATASTFAIRGQLSDGVRTQPVIDIHLFLQCNYTHCRKIFYVYTACRFSVQQTQDLPFFMYPSRAIAPPHPSIPANIADDWAEALRTMQASAPKATAVMLRRVLYGVLIDKSCKLHPLHEGLTTLIATCRLPAIFDEWLPAIKDDGHDGAHPDRSLQVSTENVAETMEYTEELLRFLYIEPYEFLERKGRNSASTGAAT
jgi:hypothetical protein